jgi:dimethylhistidine N-methyltransferase
LPCKYFYDSRGSELFDRICQLDEYYLTRTELAIMDQFAPEMGAWIGPRAMLVEFGSGSSVKTRYLLDALTGPVAYVPIDVSADQLRATGLELARDYPQIEVLPVCADFSKRLFLPRPKQAASRTTIYFPGSTIGNFLPSQAACLLRRITSYCGRGGGLLIGIDLQKDEAKIEAAYNDRLGITAEFNLNLLHRMNRELGAEFHPERFAHEARYNRSASRIEMYLISRQAQTVTLGGEAIELAAGEPICTEYSHKYTIEQFAAVAATAGLSLRDQWTDANRDFAVLYLEAA